MANILVKKIWQEQHIIFDRAGKSSVSPAQLTNTPSPVWLALDLHYSGFGDAARVLTFQQPESMINVIAGVWLVVGADSFMIDGSIDDVNAKLGGCCGENATVVQNYPNGLPAFQGPVAKSYTVVRADDGTIGAANEAMLAYSANENGGNMIPNSFSRVSRSGSNTTYSFQAYKDPAPQGTDTITETSRTFQSNVYATALSGSNVYLATGTGDGVNFSVKGTAQTLASLVTNLNADAVAKNLGTWTAGTNQVILTTTVEDVVTIVLGQVAP